MAYRPTEQQLRTLEFISAFIGDWGYAPTAKEIADAFGFDGHSAIQKQLTRLEDHGYIRRGRTIGGRVIQRSIRVIK